jgi:hypothetical protein
MKERIYGYFYKSGDLIVRSLGDTGMPAVALQGPEMKEYLANIELWEPFDEDHEPEFEVTGWLYKHELKEYLEND